MKDNPERPRPRIIALIGQKGGSGKTTLAVHLAVAAQADGEKVLVLDTDQQATATGWGDLRKAEWPMVINVLPSQVENALNGDGWRNAHGAGEATLVVMDTAPHATPDAVRAASQADLLILPCRPTAFDLHSMNAAVAVAAATGKPAAIVLSACPSRSAEMPETVTFLRKHNLPIVPTAIGNRSAYARAVSSGRSVTEFEPRGKAAQEIRAVWAWVKERLNGLA